MAIAQSQHSVCAKDPSEPLFQVTVSASGAGCGSQHARASVSKTTDDKSMRRFLIWGFILTLSAILVFLASISVYRVDEVNPMYLRADSFYGFRDSINFDYDPLTIMYQAVSVEIENAQTTGYILVRENNDLEYKGDVRLMKSIHLSARL